MLRVAPLFVLCTVFSLITDTLTKNMLASASAWDGLSITVTFFHFAVSALLGAMLWLRRRSRSSMEDRASTQSSTSTTGRSMPVPPSGAALLRALVPLAICQTAGFFCTNLSLKFVPISFSHTIKSCECLFTAALTYFILGQKLSAPAYAALIPTAAGVALSAGSELRFDIYGFLAAMASNGFFAGRSVLSTRLMRSGAVDAGTLYWWLCCFAATFVLPPFLATGGPAQLLKLERLPLLASLIACGATHYTYNLLSFQILGLTSPVTHVVLHALRRICVIAASSFLTGHVISLPNWAGIAIASAGVFCYALAPPPDNTR